MSHPNPSHDFESVRVDDDIHAPAAPPTRAKAEDGWVGCGEAQEIDKLVKQLDQINRDLRMITESIQRQHVEQENLEAGARMLRRIYK